MKVLVKANRRDPNARLAFISYTNYQGNEISLPAYFDKRDLTQPKPDTEVEVMISGVLYEKDENGHFDFSKPRCFFIKEPAENQFKVTYEGFECDTSMCTTTTNFRFVDAHLNTKKLQWMTPGKLMQSLIVADNVNARFDDRDRYPLTPGVGWVEKNAANGVWRLAGVEETKYLDFRNMKDR